MISKGRIGVLALQGAFQLHRPHIESLGAAYCEVVTAKQLERCQALIIPGGESSTLLKLIEHMQLKPALNEFLERKPAWGVCAGAILLAEDVQGPHQESLAHIDVTIERNGYGRQRDSFEDKVDAYLVSYIRAPVITRVGQKVNVLNRKNDQATWVEKDNIMLTTFHPELNQNTPSPWHERLVNQILN